MGGLSSLTAGKVLKSQTGWYSSGNGTDAFGFSALPAGYRGYDGYFIGGGSYMYFWSSTEFNSDCAYGMYLRSFSDGAYLLSNNEDVGVSVRCLKD